MGLRQKRLERLESRIAGGRILQQQAESLTHRLLRGEGRIGILQHVHEGFDDRVDLRRIGARRGDGAIERLEGALAAGVIQGFERGGWRRFDGRGN